MLRHYPSAIDTLYWYIRAVYRGYRKTPFRTNSTTNDEILTLVIHEASMQNDSHSTTEHNLLIFIVCVCKNRAISIAFLYVGWLDGLQLSLSLSYTTSLSNFSSECYHNHPPVPTKKPQPTILSRNTGYFHLIIFAYVMTPAWPVDALKKGTFSLPRVRPAMVKLLIVRDNLLSISDLEYSSSDMNYLSSAGLPVFAVLVASRIYTMHSTATPPSQNAIPQCERSYECQSWNYDLLLTSS